MKLRMNVWLWAVIGLLIGAGVAVAQSTVDQGSPGTQGPWSVKTTGGSSSTTASSSRNAKIPASQITALSTTGSACTAIGGAGCTVIYTATDWVQWPNLTITVYNAGANPLTNVLVEWSPDYVVWELWDDTTFAALAASTAKSIALSGNSRRYLRIEAKSALGSNAVVYVTANDG